MSSCKVPPPIPGVVRPVLGPSGPGDAETLAALKRTLLIAALETPPRFRSDVDVVMIQQHLASLGVFVSVAPQILQYLATECTINRIPDGEVLFYQEDVIDDHSHACIILQGSLCGYFNKAFSQRHSRRDDFRTWNSKQTNMKGVAIDFGDLQVTYGKGAICGINDFYSCPLSTSARGRQHQKPLCRHRSVHSQETTTVIVLAKDTLDRVSERFGFGYEKGVPISSKETTRTDVSHFVLFSLLSDTAQSVLLQAASIRHLKVGEVVFATGADKDPSTSAFAIIRNGRLDLHCVECSDTQIPVSADVSQSNSSAASPKNAKSSTPSLTEPQEPLASLTRGQTFGDQMIALNHAHIWASNRRRRRHTNVRFKVIAGDSSTEILWITRNQYEQQVREDQLRLSYNPIFGMASSSSSTTALASAIESHNVSQITRQLLTDATLCKFFFQFPPLVLERLCHHMKLEHFESSGILMEAGGSIDSVFIIVRGVLHTQRFQKLENERSPVKKAFVHQGSAKRMALRRDVRYIPGDVFGAQELMKCCFTCEAPVFVHSGTTLLRISRSPFERWVSALRHNTIVKAGTILQPFVWSTSLPPTSQRHSYTKHCATLTKVNRRLSGPSTFSSAVMEPDRVKEHRLEEAAILLKRLGLFPTLPRFLLAQMLAHATLMSKTAGEELFREGDVQRVLVVVLSGFVSFYSLENMSATIDMFQKHPFCFYSTFSGSSTNPEDFVVVPRADESTDCAPSAALKHRTAMYGVHIQTLPSRNAFRTGVLQEGTVCPATVLAQTDCEYFLLDGNMYTRLLDEHVPTVDMSAYNVTCEPSETASAPNSVNLKPQTPLKPIIPTQPGVIPLSLLSYLEAARIPWLPPCSAKKTLLLRSMHHMHLAPGQRLIQHNETIQQVVLVVTGKLAVYVRENQEVASVLNVSQRSVQSAALEQSVASNYSTTSQQLYQDRSGTVGTGNRTALRRRIARIAEIDTSDDTSKSKFASSTSRFTDLVLHATRESKSQQSEKTDESQLVAHAPKNPPRTRRSLHSMVNKVKLKRKTGDQSVSNALFMCHMGPGDIYGEEISVPVGIFRSAHDIYADTSIPGAPGAKEAGSSRSQTSLAGTEVLCLDRHLFHLILSRTEEDAANELLGISSHAKAKWQLASQKLFKRASHSTIDEPGEHMKTPKLFDFFNNILNQRRFLTMGTITHFPLLRDLSDDARRELGLNARFEALDRYTDAYKGNGDSNGTGHRFFLLLSGRINLVANGPNSHIVSQGMSSSIPDHNLREVVAGEGFGEFEILIPDSPAHIAAIAAEPTKLLSISAEMFEKHWPCTNEARANIEYLRTRIPSFASLELERIAYLYHSFSFQSHVRGTTIFQLHDSKRAPAKEVYLVKEGTCCIRQYVTLISRSGGDFRFDPCDDERNTTQNEDIVLSHTGKGVKRVQILSTVANVSAGHVFWIDAEHFPIALVTTSAAVTIASVSIEKLKAIVPRGMLASLEELSHQLGEVYAQQFELAKRATVAVLNEQLSQRKEQTRRLPTIQPRIAQSLTQFCGEIPSYSIQRKTSNDLVEFTAHDGTSVHTERFNAEYKSQHQIERYEIPNELPVSYLVGSFLDRKRGRQNTDAIPSKDESLTESASKTEESSTPEFTDGSVSIQQKAANRHLHLEVKVPVAGHVHNCKSSANLREFPTTKPTSDRGKGELKVSDQAISSSSVDVDEVITSVQNGLMVYQVDVRARVHALMCMVGSPMRAMRLEPSRIIVNSLGKYAADCPSPFARLGDSSRRAYMQLEHQYPTPRSRSKPKPTQTPRSNPKLLQAIGPSATIRRPELTRKQGFLTSLRVKIGAPFESDEHAFLDLILPRIRKGRRFFYALVDSELREYADTISLNNLAQTSCLGSYNLSNPRRPCRINDVPVMYGEAETILRQSFILIVDDATQFFFTASSTIDKQNWMTELNQASALGELQHSISIKVQSPRPVETATPPAVLAAVVIDAFKGRRKSTIKERKRTSIFVPKSDDPLHVEYRII